MLQRTITSSAHPVPAALIADGYEFCIAVDGYCHLGDYGYAIAQSSHDTKLGARFAILARDGYPVAGSENLSAAQVAQEAKEILDGGWACPKPRPFGA